MGNQCCKVPQKNVNEIVLYEAASVKNSSLCKQSIHSQSFTNKMKQEDEIREVVKENYDEISPEIVKEDIQVEVHFQRPKAKQESRVSDETPKKRGTISSVGTLKLGADVFISLKQGSIHKYYTKGSVLGQGAYGKVWKVTHNNTGMVRAMKQLKKSSLILEEQQRLFAEMNILKNLDHPHIVKLYELFQDQQNYYLITEYLSGGELFDRIKQMNYFSEKKAAEFMRQILSAVVYCHEQKIVHRDLKPENILFVNESNNAPLKVIDFGTSRKYDSQKKMTKKLGTPYYIAPEVLKQDYNEKCDVWSCGVILYILLCGYPPFTGKTEKEIMKKVSEGKFEFEEEDWGMVSKDAKSLITKMLQVNPNQRITTKQALNDQWILKHYNDQKFDQLMNHKVLANLQKFQAKSLFAQAVLSYIASQMTTQQEQDELLKTFQQLDKNHDGILSKEELIEGYTHILKDKELAELEVTKILQIIDLNQSGQVDFSEFLMAAINQEKLVSLQRVKAAFKVFDANEDGRISKDEMELMIGSLDEELWTIILEECGAQDSITEKQFMDILLNQKL